MLTIKIISSLIDELRIRNFDLIISHNFINTSENKCNYFERKLHSNCLLPPWRRRRRKLTGVR